MPKWLKVIISIIAIAVALFVVGSCVADSDDSIEVAESCREFRKGYHAMRLSGLSEQEIMQAVALQQAEIEGIPVAEARQRIEAVNEICAELAR